MRINNDVNVSPIRMELQAKQVKETPKDSPSSISSAGVAGCFQTVLNWISSFVQTLIKCITCGLYRQTDTKTEKDSEVEEPNLESDSEIEELSADKKITEFKTKPPSLNAIPSLAEMKIDSANEIVRALREYPEDKALAKEYALNLEPRLIQTVMKSEVHREVMRNDFTLYHEWDQFVLAGICQGQFGNYVSKRVSQEFVGFFKEALSENGGAIRDAFIQAAEKMNASLLKDYNDKNEGHFGGSEATFCIIDKKTGLQYVATIGGNCEVKNVSESGKVFSVSGVRNLATDCERFTTTNVTGLTRQNANRLLSFPWGMKMTYSVHVSRSFGHFDVNDSAAKIQNNRGEIICTPIVTLFNAGKWVVIGTSSLWDKITPEELAASFKETEQPSEIAKNIVMKAIQKGSKGNISVMVLKIDF